MGKDLKGKELGKGISQRQMDAILQDLQAKQENVKRFMILN